MLRGAAAVRRTAISMTAASPSRRAIAFRAQTAADAPFLRYLYGTTREDELRVLRWTEEQKSAFLDMQFGAQKQDYEANYPDCTFDVIELNGEPIGRLYVDRRERVIEIIDIALLPQFRRRGIGRMLLEEVLAEGAASRRNVRIYVEHFNPARHLYDRLGFRHIETNGVYHLMEWTPSPSSPDATT
jgi:ribosomal protein S18 acetylase RimI-like enzyme